MVLLFKDSLLPIILFGLLMEWIFILYGLYQRL